MSNKRRSDEDPESASSSRETKVTQPRSDCAGCQTANVPRNLLPRSKSRLCLRGDCRTMTLLRGVTWMGLTDKTPTIPTTAHAHCANDRLFVSSTSDVARRPSRVAPQSKSQREERGSGCRNTRPPDERLATCVEGRNRPDRTSKHRGLAPWRRGAQRFRC